MVTRSEVKTVILDNKYISEAEIWQNENFEGEKYSWLIKCKLDVLNEWLPIMIGIPKSWEINLFDFYLLEELPFIPHINKKGKLCLFDLEGTMIYPEFKGLLHQCILRAKDLISDGILGNNKEDFLIEFDSYFALLDNNSTAKVAFPDNKNHFNIKFCEKVNGTKKTRNKQIVNGRKGDQKTSYFASFNQEDFSTWGVHSTQKNGIYLWINPTEYIYPPNIFDYSLERYLNELLAFVDVRVFNKLRNKCSGDLVLFFEIQQDIKTVSNCGFRIKKPKFMENNKVELVGCDCIIPISIERVDVNYLSSRTMFSSNKIADKSVLLIGCGSIGGYVFHNLIKSGCKNITLVDDDVMKPANIFRHFLGAESAYCNKAKALVNYAKKALPMVYIKAISKRIEEAIFDGDIDFTDFDYIVSATGSHTINRWINEYMLKNRILKTVFYIWNEPLDIGCHVARINISNEGDYKNLFAINDTGVIDLSSYASSGQHFTKMYSGCTGTFIPYSSTLSSESSTLFIEMLKSDLEERIQKNIIVSKKGDDYFFKKAGFFVSSRYSNQKERYLEMPICEIGKDDI